MAQYTDGMVLLIRGISTHGKDSLYRANQAGDLNVVHSSIPRGGYCSFVSSKSTGLSWVSFDSLYRGSRQRRNVFDALIKNKFVRFAFANKLKNQVAERYGVTLQWIDDHKDQLIQDEHHKNRINPTVQNYRDDLIATAAHERSIDPEVFIHDVAQAIKDHPYLIITDYRNPNECIFVKRLCEVINIPFYTIEMIRPLTNVAVELSASEHYIDNSLPDIIMCSTEDYE